MDIVILVKLNVILNCTLKFKMYKKKTISAFPKKSMIKKLKQLDYKGKKDHICLLAFQSLGCVYNSKTISLFQRPNTKLEHGHCPKKRVTYFSYPLYLYSLTLTTQKIQILLIAGRERTLVFLAVKVLNKHVTPFVWPKKL